jgi:hypothetical protein
VLYNTPELHHHAHPEVIAMKYSLKPCAPFYTEIPEMGGTYESKTFWFGLLTIGTKAKHIDLVQRIFYCEQIVSVLAQILF